MKKNIIIALILIIGFINIIMLSIIQKQNNVIIEKQDQTIELCDSMIQCTIDSIPPILTQTQFYETFLPYADYIWNEYRILPSVFIAQMALESGWGKQGIGYNVLGIKAIKDEPRVEKTTKEHSKSANAFKNKNIISKTKVNNTYIYTITDYFKFYTGYDECIDDYGKKLSSNKRYASIINDTCYKSVAMKLSKCGYATDVNYAGKIKSIVERENLNLIDILVLNKAV